MTNLVLRDNFFQDLFDFRRDFDEIFNRILLGKPLVREQMPGTTFGFLPPVESYVEKDNKKYICRVHLSGIEPGEVEIHVKGNLLTIKGERKVTTSSKEVNLMNEEVAYGSFERTIELPEGVLPEKLTAEYRNGVLEIMAPVAEAALPRKIEIKTLPMTKKAAA
ncbi:MAG TPA: Hsp20/alpha crystallin family protein [Candidatus Acidoferrum sp.]|nr:Hsp20/alpha crystallin family protein [Candidatus Acidoferrum sp.]